MFAVFATSLLIVSAYSCSIAYPQEATTYVSNVQLLSDSTYPDQVLLTIQRTSSMAFNIKPRLNYANNGPWCKIMNVHDGSVTDVVPCGDYSTHVRAYALSDTDPKSTSVSCHDSCDGLTATCSITRDGITRTINDIPYADSTANCQQVQEYFGWNSMFSSFTLNDISTTYISFSTNMVGIEFDDISGISPAPFNIYNVQRMGDWNYLVPGQYGIGNTPAMYSDVNVMRVSLPCCLCYGSKLNMYTISTDPSTMTQVFTMKSLGFGGGRVDSVKQRVFNDGMFFSDSVTMYDLSDSGVASVLRPDLCDRLVYCSMPPCSAPGIGCPHNRGATCVNDYCGGCNARWFCGASDITLMCDSAFTSNQICANEPNVALKTTVLH